MGLRKDAGSDDGGRHRAPHPGGASPGYGRWRKLWVAGGVFVACFQHTQAYLTLMVHMLQNSSVEHAWALPPSTFGGAYAKFMGDRNFQADDR